MFYIFAKRISLFSIIFLGLGIGGCMPDAFLVQPITISSGLMEKVIHSDGVLVSDKIVIIDVDGIIMNATPQGTILGTSTGENPVSIFVTKLNKIKNDGHVKAVILRLNTPGGSVNASDIMHHELKKFKAATGIPVIACMMDLACSGGYYLAMATDGIIAQPATITGSIGVIMHLYSYEKTLGLLGLKSHVIKSGKLKDLGSPSHTLTEEERVVMQAIIDEFYQNFLGVILEGRPGLTMETLLPLADGRVYTAPLAKKHGLIDRIGYPNDAIVWAKEMANVKKAKVVIYQSVFGASSNIYSTTNTNPPSSGSLVNIALPDFLKNEAPQFLYLWQH